MKMTKWAIIGFVFIVLVMGYVTYNNPNFIQNLSGNIVGGGPTGTLNVIAIPNGAKYQVVNGTTGRIMIEEAAGSQLFNLPQGNYTVMFVELPGLKKPINQSVQVTTGGSVSVKGIYQNR